MEGIWPVDPDGKVFQVGFQVGPHARPPLSARSKQMLSCLGLLLQTLNALCALYRSAAPDSGFAQRPTILSRGYYNDLC